jgi:hypothetical protein
MNPPKYRVLIEVIPDVDATNRFYIQSIESNAILFETGTERLANEICGMWNDHQEIPQRNDGTLDFDSLDTPPA